MAKQYSWVPLKIASIYALTGCLWILFSDRAIWLFTSDPATITGISMVKGWLFVLLTAILLYWLIRRYTAAARHSEDKLTASEEKFSKAFSYSPVLMTLSAIDDGRYLEVNERFSQVSGFSRQESVGRTPVEMGWISSANRERMLRRLRGDGRVSNMELDLTSKDGRSVSCLFSAEIVTIEGEQRLLAIAQDITPRKEAEKALKESEKRYRLFSSITSDYLTCCSRNGMAPFRVNWLAGAIEAITGYSQEQVLEWGCWMPIVHPDDVGRIKQRLLELKPGDTSSDEYRIVRKDGEIRWIHEVHRCEAGDSPGELLRFGSSQDITTRKAAEAAILKWNEDLERLVKERTVDLEQSNEELATFCYAISHELRAPIARLQGFSSILGEECKGEDETSFMAARIVNASRQLQVVVDSILLLSRLSKMELSLQEVNLSKMAKMTMGTLLAENPERKLEFVVAPDVKAVADPNLMDICMNNLIGNAFKYTGRTSDARIEIGVLTDSGKKVYFVRDNGAGFDMAYSEKLYAPFERLHMQEDFPGIGIGLATVKKIIERHGGEIWAESGSGEGAAFYFTLGARR